MFLLHLLNTEGMREVLLKYSALLKKMEGMQEKKSGWRRGRLAGRKNLGELVDNFSHGDRLPLERCRSPSRDCSVDIGESWFADVSCSVSEVDSTEWCIRFLTKALVLFPLRVEACVLSAAISLRLLSIWEPRVVMKLEMATKIKVLCRNSVDVILWDVDRIEIVFMKRWFRIFARALYSLPINSWTRSESGLAGFYHGQTSHLGAEKKKGDKPVQKIHFRRTKSSNRYDSFL